MEAAFLKFLNRYGIDVQVTTKTPQLEEDGITEVVDDRGKVQFDEEFNILKARMKVLTGREKEIEKLDLKPGDATGLFRLDDIEYLNDESYVYFETYAGPQFNFKILDVIPHQTHIQVLMHRIK